MSFRLLILALLVFSQMSFAQGRKPAVEDFVGIEVDEPVTTPQGTEHLFNFEKEMDTFQKNKALPSKGKAEISQGKQAGPGTVVTVGTVIFLVGLPVMIWFMVMNHMKQKAHLESASNIRVLEKYRQERQDAKKSQEEYKKVS